MRRLQVLAAFLFCTGIFAGRISAQIIPLVPGTEWIYHDSELGDTVARRIVGNGPASVSCTRGSQSQAGWFDNLNYIYLPVNGGVMIGRSRPSDKVAMAVEPMLLIPDSSSRRGKGGCEGEYVLIGVATVETPAGRFENCLVFDDHNVHRICIKPGVGIVKEELYKEGTMAAGERVLASSRTLVRYRLMEPEGRTR